MNADGEISWLEEKPLGTEMGRNNYEGCDLQNVAASDSVMACLLHYGEDAWILKGVWNFLVYNG